MSIPPILSGAEPAPPRSDAAKLADSAREFEAMMVRQVLSDTFKPSPAAGIRAMPGSEIYQGFITDAVADHISGSLGISSLLQSQLASAQVRLRPPQRLPQ